MLNPEESNLNFVNTRNDLKSRLNSMEPRQTELNDVSNDKTSDISGLQSRP